MNQDDVHSFSEQAAHEVGFSAIYQKELAPFLQRMERQRRAVNAKAKRRLLVIMTLSTGLAVWAAASVHPAAALFPLFIGGVLSLFIFLQRGEKLSDELSEKVCEVIGQFLGDMNHGSEALEGRLNLDEARSLQVLPKVEHTRKGAGLSGIWRGVDFAIAQIDCWNNRKDHKGNRRRETIFAGILLEIACPVEMPRTVLLADFGEQMNQVYAWATAADLRKSTSTSKMPASSRFLRSLPTIPHRRGASLSPDLRRS